MGNISEKSTAAATDPGEWLGRVIIGVLLGEAIWNLMVSAVSNLFVPWLGDVMGQSSGLPASFTQRPYNYPDFFVSFWESCVAAFLAAVLNYFLRQTAARLKPAKTVVRAKPVEAPVSISQNPALEQAFRNQPLSTEAAPVMKPDPVMYASVTVVPPAPSTAPEPAVRPAAVAQELPPDPLPTAKPPQSVPKIESKKTEKHKEVYYNLVGEPLPSDEESR